LKKLKLRTKSLTQEQLRIAWRLLVIYFAALLIPAITGTVIYFSQIRQVEQEILERRSKSLALNKQIVESAILSIEKTVTEIRQDDELSKLTEFENPLDTKAGLKVLDAYNNSRLSLTVSDYVLDIQVYIKRPNLLLTLNDIFFDPEIYYKYFFQISDKPYEVWLNELRTDNYIHNRLEFSSIILNGVNKDAIVFRSSLPYATRLKSTGVVAVYIDRQSVENLLETYLAGYNGFAFIKLPDGRLLASIGTGVESRNIFTKSPGNPRGVEFINIEGREFAVSYIQSSVNRWIYVTGTPVEVFYSQSRRLRVVFIGLALLIVVVGLPILFFQVFGVSRPIAQTSQILKNGVVLSENMNTDPFRFISDSVGELIKRDRSLKQLLDEQKPMVQGVILERLFRGEFKGNVEARTFLDHFGLTAPSTRSLVLCVVIEGYFEMVTPEILAEFTVKSALIRDELERLLPASALIHNVSHNVIGIVIFTDEEERELKSNRPIDVTLRLIISRLRALQDVRCTVSTGGTVNNLCGISEALQGAIQTAEHAEPGSVNADVKNSCPCTSDYYFPAELEIRLISTVRAGKTAEVKNITAEIKKENLKNRTLSRECFRRLYQELDAARIKIERRLVNGKLPPLSTDTALSADERIERVLNYLIDLSEHIEKSGSLGNRLKAPIESFVHENALNYEMGLKLVAMRFNLSEVYVSHLFRELFGENFHSYVEKIRMEHAVQLLRTTSLNVDEIADRVGYQSANTFRRVFKRHFGVSPSAYTSSNA